MRIRNGDSVRRVSNSEQVGLVTARVGNSHIIFRSAQHGLIDAEKDDVDLVAVAVQEAVLAGKNKYFKCPLNGRGTLAELAQAFGHPINSRLPSARLQAIRGQLSRAGLKLKTFGSESANSAFQLEQLSLDPSYAEESDLDQPASKAEASAPASSFLLGQTFWPEDLGLSPHDLVRFLRALWEDAPLICILTRSNSPELEWLPELWEGLVTWAYGSAQGFKLRNEYDSPKVTIRRIASSQVSKLNRANLRSGDDERGASTAARSLNLLITDDEPNGRDIVRLRNLWPGEVFEFRPMLEESETNAIPGLTGTIQLLCAMSGASMDERQNQNRNPAEQLSMVKEELSLLFAKSLGQSARVLKDVGKKRFKGSTEGSIALALKIAVACSASEGRNVSFETQPDADVHENNTGEVNETPKRVDVLVDGAVCEIESMRASGPMELFFHQKFFRRIRKGQIFNVVVPAESLLWAGPFFADLVDNAPAGCSVVFPVCTDAGVKLVALEPKSLPTLDVKARSDSYAKASIEDTEERLTLDDVIGYGAMLERINTDIIWPLDHPHLARIAGNSPNVLLYGPPGCGKSHLAQGICGQLKQEVRLLSPVDLRGVFVGEGQVMIRQQFDWLLEADQRMLIIDEFDAVARSRFGEGGMHSDEKANVNELLVQLDRARRGSRFVMCTTNFVQSIDPAVLRSGRFGHFIPVHPPDKQAVIEIALYYLAKLKHRAEKEEEQPVIQVPEEGDVATVVLNNFSESRADGSRMCAADVAQAVNKCYFEAARKASERASQKQASRLEINLDTFLLNKHFGQTPYSITAESYDQFENDLSRFGTR